MLPQWGLYGERSHISKVQHNDGSVEYIESIECKGKWTPAARIKWKFDAQIAAAEPGATLTVEMLKAPAGTGPVPGSRPAPPLPPAHYDGGIKSINAREMSKTSLGA
jgi:hypothetical protein